MHWHYKNLTILLVSFLITYAFAQTYLYQALLTNLQAVGFFGIFLVGLFFVSIFTVAPAAVVLVGLGQHYDPLVLAPIAATGAVAGDYIIFRFIREGVLGEIRELLGKQQFQRFLHPFQSRYFAWLLPLIGVLIIITPLPDEMGVGLLGVSKIKQWAFIFLVFFLHTTGIYALVRLTN